MNSHLLSNQKENNAMSDLHQIAMESGASLFSPPPMRAVRGVSFTFEALEEFARRVLEQQFSSQKPFGWWVEGQQANQFITAADFVGKSFDTGKFTALYQLATPGEATAQQLEAAWREGWAKGRGGAGCSEDQEDMAWANSDAYTQAVGAAESVPLSKAAYLCVEESGAIDFEVIPPCTLPAGEYDLFAMLRSSGNQAFATSKPVPAKKAEQEAGPVFNSGIPPIGTEAAWLLVATDGRAEVARVVLGVHANTKHGDEWCVAGDWKAESHHGSIRDGGESVIGWIPYQVPSASNAGLACALRQLPISALHALVDVARERVRQIVEKGRDAKHDDRYTSNELASAAGVYADLVSGMSKDDVLNQWPWSPEQLKTGDKRQMMVIATALGLAQIELFDRQNASAMKG